MASSKNNYIVHSRVNQKSKKYGANKSLSPAERLELSTLRSLDLKSLTRSLIEVS